MRVPPLGGTASARGSAGGSATLGMIDGTEPVFRLPQALTPLALDDDGHDDEEENEQAHHDQATHVQVALGDLLAPELHVGAREAEGDGEPEGQDDGHGHAGHSGTPTKGENCGHDECDQDGSPKRVHCGASTFS
jgi:hypothetical protein